MRIQLSRDTAAIARKVLKIEHFASGGDLHAVSRPFSFQVAGYQTQVGEIRQKT